ncbi:MAG: hypothetical protein RJA70_702 [Pseudomonadota bacterium]|jgi:hypothetical protein
MGIMMPSSSRGPSEEPLDLTTVMVFTVAALGLGGYSLFSLLSLLAR